MKAPWWDRWGCWWHRLEMFQQAAVIAVAVELVAFGIIAVVVW